jgi:hypothetical protein
MTERAVAQLPVVELAQTGQDQREHATGQDERERATRLARERAAA